MTFDEWFEEENWELAYGRDGEFHYGASVAWGYKQAEIDALNALGEMSEQKIDDLVLRNIELQKRIDDVVKSLEGVKSTGFRPHCYDYDKGWRDCAITTLNDLKGDKND